MALICRLFSGDWSLLTATHPARGWGFVSQSVQLVILYVCRFYCMYIYIIISDFLFAIFTSWIDFVMKSWCFCAPFFTKKNQFLICSRTLWICSGTTSANSVCYLKSMGNTTFADSYCLSVNSASTLRNLPQLVGSKCPEEESLVAEEYGAQAENVSGICDTLYTISLKRNCLMYLTTVPTTSRKNVSFHLVLHKKPSLYERLTQAGERRAGQVAWRGSCGGFLSPPKRPALQ